MLPSFSPVPNAPFSMSQPSPKPFILTDGWGLLTTKLPLLVVVRHSGKCTHQYIWVPSPSLAGSIVSFADCSEVMGHVVHFWSVVRWCDKVHDCHAWHLKFLPWPQTDWSPSRMKRICWKATGLWMMKGSWVPVPHGRRKPIIQPSHHAMSKK